MPNTMTMQKKVRTEKVFALSFRSQLEKGW